MKNRVVIVGAGLSGLAAAFRLRQAGCDVLLLEREAHVGGKARTSTHVVDAGTLTFDWGPNGFLTNAPDTLELVRDLGLTAELEPASDAAKHRFLWSNQKLEKLPSTPPTALGTPLLSPLEKLRALAEVFVPKLGEPKPESVFEFALRRFGRGVAEKFILPMVVGITAGDARHTSLDALFPRMRAMEQAKGSVLRAMIAAQREAKKSGKAAPSSRLTSFKQGGIGRLSEGIWEHLGLSVRTGVTVNRLERVGRAYRVHSDAGMFDADWVILAVPAFVAAKLLEPLHHDLADELERIPYADVRTFGLAYRAEDVPTSLDGFGFLTARDDQTRILGCLYTSTLFPAQGGAGLASLRVICGGALDPEFTQLSDADALEVVKHDLQRTLGITAAPVSVQQARWDRGIPQYTLEHPARVVRIESLLTGLPGVFLTGNAYRGIGVNDCVRDATRISRAIIQALGASTPENALVAR